MRPVLFYLFGLPVGSYGFCMMIAHLLGVGTLLWIVRNNGWPLGPFLDVIFAVLVSALIGARLGYAYFHWREFQAHPSDLLSLWKGGLSFFGGFPPAFFVFLGMLRWRRIPVLPAADQLCPVMPFTLGLMRIGCFLQGCCYGIPTELPWGVTFTRLDSKVPQPLLDHPLHPTQLYESAFLLLLAGALTLWLRRNRLAPGMLATISIFAYCAFRLAADQLRGDLDRNFLGVSWLTPTQGAALLGILATPLVLAICARQARRP